MSEKCKESDWKQFRKIVPELRERYLEKKNKEFLKILTSPDKTPTEQFWDTLKEMKKEKRVLEDCLDRHSRSNQFFSMMLMCRYGMIKREDLDTFSEEIRSELEEHLKD